MSDSPTFYTGFATVTRELLSRLTATGRVEVACVGWGYDGWPYDHTVIPYRLYPSVPPNLGKDTLGRAIDEFRPDVVVTLGDIWMVEWVATVERRYPWRLVAYVPIDAAPLYRPWQPFLRAVDRVVTCSRFGQELVEAAVPDRSVEMIPHGVDTTVYRPLPGRPRPPELEGKFIVGCTARNQPRKNLPALIEAFAQVCRHRDDAVLYLHSDPDDIGWDLLDLLDRHGVFHRTCITKSASITNGVSPHRLNAIYNLFDVMALPTAGEGFGLPILEAMAAGVPVVATRYSSCVELLADGRGELVKVKGYLTAGRHNVNYAIADIDDLAEIIVALGDDSNRRRSCQQSGRAYAETLDWNHIAPQWENLVTSFGP